MNVNAISTHKIQEWEQLTHEEKHTEAMLSVAKYFGLAKFVKAFQEILQGQTTNTFDNSCRLLANSMMIQIAYENGEAVSDLVYSCL